MTFHGPGQLVVYPIAGIRDLKFGARAWVEGLEDCIVDVAALYGVEARVRPEVIAARIMASSRSFIVSMPPSTSVVFNGYPSYKGWSFTLLPWMLSSQLCYSLCGERGG